MKVGLDMDDTICSTDETIRLYADIYCKEKMITAEEIWTNDGLKQEFLNKYLEKIYIKAPLKRGAATVINSLKKSGYEVIIVTARSDNYISIGMEKLITDYLTKNKIKVDKIIVNAKNKVNACKKWKIDLMLEDNSYNYNLLVNAGIKTVLYDEENKHPDIDTRITDWDEFINYFEIDG